MINHSCLMPTDTKWPEKSPVTESLMENGCVCSMASAFQHSRECLFCLEGEDVGADYTDNDEAKSQSQPPSTLAPLPQRPPPPTTTNAEQLISIAIQTDLESGLLARPRTNEDANKDTTNTVVSVLDYGDLFPCKCSVYSHGNCLQIWLDNEQCCPICKRPIEHVKSPSSNFIPASHSLPTLHTNDSGDRNEETTDRHASPINYGLRLCCYSSLSITFAYFIWYSSTNE